MEEKPLPERRGFSVTIDCQFEAFMEDGIRKQLIVFLCNGFPFFIEEKEIADKGVGVGEYYKTYSYLAKHLSSFLSMATNEAHLYSEFNIRLENGGKWRDMRPQLSKATGELRKKNDEKREATLTKARVGIPIASWVDEKLRSTVKHFASEVKLPSKTAFSIKAGFGSVTRFNQTLEARGITWESVIRFIELEKKVRTFST